MTLRQAATFFFVVTGVFTAVFVGLTIHSHTRFGELTNADRITDEVLAGKDVWHHNNCVNCHTLMGEGAYFAPDLTRITRHRGDAYLTSFMQDPGHRRSVPDGPGPDAGVRRPGGARRIALPVLAPGLLHLPLHIARRDPGGPSVAGMATRAAEVVASEDYTGSAATAEDYVRESILEPHAYITEGPDFYTIDRRSLMPDNYDETLTAEQTEQLVAYLMSLR